MTLRATSRSARVRSTMVNSEEVLGSNDSHHCWSTGGSPATAAESYPSTDHDEITRDFRVDTCLSDVSDNPATFFSLARRHGQGSYRWPVEVSGRHGRCEARQCDGMAIGGGLEGPDHRLRFVYQEVPVIIECFFSGFRRIRKPTWARIRALASHCQFVCRKIGIVSLGSNTTSI